MKRQQPKAPAGDGRSDAPSASGPQIEVRSDVLRDIRQHARSSMSAEICGVLIGAVRDGITVVEASIQGNDARQGGSHVTFTQDTWSHIYQVKDSKYPDKRIVGWYHSHPGFGIFLSEHDTFIHTNFFSDPSQIAWVYDPHSDEEGCFAWAGSELKRLSQIGIRDAGDGLKQPQAQVRESRADSSAGSVEATMGEAINKAEPDRRSWVRFGLLFLSHCLAVIVGYAAGFILSPEVIIVPERALSRQGRPARQQDPQVMARPEEVPRK